MKKILSALFASVLVLGGLFVATPAMATQPSTPIVCEAIPQLTEQQYVRGSEGSAAEGYDQTYYRWESVFKSGKRLKGVYVELPNSWHKGDPNVMYELPAEKQPDRFDGIAPTGNVPVSVYGGPGSWGSVYYDYGVSYNVQFPEDGSWTTDPTPPVAPGGSSWGQPIVKTEWVETKPATDDTREWEWFAEDPGGDWTATGEIRVIQDAQDANWQNTDPNGECFNGPEQPATLDGEELRSSDPVCVVPADGTAVVTTERRTWTQDSEYDSELTEWVFQDRIFSEWEFSEDETVILEDCDPVVEPPIEEPEEPVEDPDTDDKSVAVPVKNPQTPNKAVDHILAETGSPMLYAGIALGGAGLVGGSILLFGRKFTGV